MFPVSVSYSVYSDHSTIAYTLYIVLFSLHTLHPVTLFPVPVYSLLCSYFKPNQPTFILKLQLINLLILLFLRPYKDMFL